MKKRNETMTVIGHQNQDTDSTVAAICLAKYLEKKYKIKAIPKISDKPNKETEYVLKKIKEKTPVKYSPKKNEKVYLVDFNEESQSPVNFKNITLEGLVDHHKLSLKISTEYPILFRIEPIGSTSSIIAKMYKEDNIKIDKKSAGLLLCAIISDTLKFSSPTTTDEDKKIAKELVKISGVKINEIAKKMFEAKSDLTGISASKIITTDYKEFKFGNKKTAIAVIETVNPTSVLEKERDIRKALSEHKKKQKLDLIYFGIVDIMNNHTTMILVGKEEEEIIKKIFSKFKTNNGTMEMPGIVSRKKQLVPDFEKKLK